MTSDRDFDRLARAWLEYGPDQAPDRAVAAVLQAAEVTPQVRRSFRWPRWRSSSMNRLPLAVGAVTVLVVAIGGTLLMSQGKQTGVGAPTGSPSAQPTATPSMAPSASIANGVPVPAAFDHTWMGPSRDIPGLVSTTRMQVVFTGPLAWVSGTQLGFASHLTSNVDAGPSSIRLTLQSDEAGCQAGTIGTYPYSLSPTGLTLTMHAATDPCAARAAAMTGTWFRTDCKVADDGCFGDLDAGTYASQYIAPRRGVGGSWQPNWGALTYSVPAGWSNSQDWPNEFSLTPSADYATETANGPAEGGIHEIWIVANPVPNKVTPDCGASIETVAPTPDGLIGWLASAPGLVVSKPTSIIVGAHSGKWVDIRLASNWKATCPGGTEPARALFSYPSQTDDNAWTAGIAGQERYRVIVIDLDGHPLGILIDSSDPAKFDDLVSQSMPIINSFKFQ
jgi:hypothetical protein